jgi:hypothetical protein
MLSLTHVKKGISGKQVVQPIVSLGFPKELFHSSKRWVLRMPSKDSALDAVYVLNKHIQELWPFMGEQVKVQYLDSLPPGETFVSKRIRGRAEK